MKNIPVADLHVHTDYSFDSKSSMRQYIEVALEKGVKFLCFTDHIDCTEIFNMFDPALLERRAVEFSMLKKEYNGQLTLLLGVEFGEPHLNMKQFDFVKSLPLDMIIGSVHYPLDYGRNILKEYSHREYENIYNSFVYDMLCFGGFDVLGHIDMPKRYHSDYAEDTDAIKANLKLCVKKGIVPEINTSTLRKGVAETMPSLEMINYYRECGGKYVTINSDSHAADDLASDFIETAGKLPGGVECCYFSNRKLIPLKN